MIFEFVYTDGKKKITIKVFRYFDYGFSKYGIYKKNESKGKIQG